MSLEKNTLVETLNDSNKNLHQGIDRHCCLVSAILADKFDERNLESFLDQFHSESRKILLRDAIKDRH